jgi:hypothetical protein
MDLINPEQSAIVRIIVKSKIPCLSRYATSFFPFYLLAKLRPLHIDFYWRTVLLEHAALRLRMWFFIHLSLRVGIFSIKQIECQMVLIRILSAHRLPACAPENE